MWHLVAIYAALSLQLPGTGSVLGVLAWAMVLTVAVVPVVGWAEDLAARRSPTLWPRVVVRPALSAAARGTGRFSRAARRPSRPGPPGGGADVGDHLGCGHRAERTAGRQLQPTAVTEQEAGGVQVAGARGVDELVDRFGLDVDQVVSVTITDPFSERVSAATAPWWRTRAAASSNESVW